ncbi:hypothetical protein Nepgr_009160 [Nepenthes gracilis]|uniref:60S acidic ribosomal protein P2 n=1 Tax=Nepenthes gracilis TaxID=150966 RepID=A0AAD3XK40_NEPGR|nr:hypothetical protein Nepgr_009160 [Nepenthes gracilis]
MRGVSYFYAVGRLDIVHTVGIISRFLLNPGKEHWSVVKWIMRYIRGTFKKCLCLGSDEPQLVGYSTILIWPKTLTPVSLPQKTLAICYLRRELRLQLKLWASQQRLKFLVTPFVQSSKMKVVAAYLLAVLGGNASPSADDLKDILGSVGAEADDDMIELLLSEVDGKDITELIASGREKLASVPAGGGGAIAVAAATPGGGGGGAAPAPAAEPKKEEKVEEKEESDDDMGFSLFD